MSDALLLNAAGCWLPALVRVCGVDEAGGVVHAVQPLSTFARDRRYRRTIVNRRVPPARWDVACGWKRCSGLWAVAMVTDEGVRIGSSAMAWPPPVCEARDRGWTRCADCMTATRARRPHPMWQRFRQSPPDNETTKET